MTGRAGMIIAALAIPIRLGVGGLFIWAALYKIAAPQEFALSIATYEILPLGTINLMAIVLPWIEVVAGLSLIVGFWTRSSAILIAGMLVLFIIAIAFALSQGRQISCGCFSSSAAGNEMTGLTLWRDVLWLLGTLYVLLADDGRFGLDRWFRSSPAQKPIS